MDKVVHSFDVFDTVLTRIWANPKDLFFQVGSILSDKGLISISPEEWLTLRVSAETNTRKKNSTDEIQLIQIYRAIGAILDWEETTIKEALHVEIEVERSSLRSIPETFQRIKEIHESGDVVIFISDMYLPAEAIQAFLVENYLWQDGDILYASSAEEVRKSSGKLFQKCLEEQGISSSQLKHLGDNLQSDVVVAKSLGIRAEHFSSALLNRYEQGLAKCESLPLKLRSLLAGSGRLARLQCPYTDPHRQVIWNTASNVMGPVLFGFVHWCLHEAQEKGVERLYFVARDGQVLLKIANIICRAWKYNVDCRYLYSSRQALKFPSIEAIGDYELSWIFDFNQAFLSVDTVCERVNIQPSQIIDVLLQHNFPQEDWAKDLTLSERDRLKDIFRTEKSIINLIVATAEEYREAAIGYFIQEGMSEGIPVGFVDFGWKGSLLKALSSLLESVNLRPQSGMQGFYFALKKRVDLLPKDSLFAYYYDNLKPDTDRLEYCKCSELFEALVAADHGSTVKFEKTDDGFTPVLRNQENKEAIEWGIHAYQEAIVCFTETFTSVYEDVHFASEQSRMIADQLLRQFIMHPTRAEAETFGSLQHSQDMVEAQLYSLAPELTRSNCFNLLFRGKSLPSFVWMPGVFARSKPSLAQLYRSCLRLRQSLQALKQTLSRIKNPKKQSANNG